MASWVTLAEVKDMMNMAPTDTAHDVKIQTFIDSATPVIEYIVGPVLQQTFTENHRTYGQSKIVLRNSPVISITTLTEFIGLTAYTLSEQEPGATTNNYGYALDITGNGVITRMSSVGTEMGFIGNVVTVTYLAGLLTVPADIRLAAIEDVRAMFQQTQLGGRPQYGGGASQEDGWQPAPIASFPRLRMLLERARRIPSIG